MYKYIMYICVCVCIRIQKLIMLRRVLGGPNPVDLSINPSPSSSSSSALVENLKIPLWRRCIHATARGRPVGTCTRRCYCYTSSVRRRLYPLNAKIQNVFLETRSMIIIYVYHVARTWRIIIFTPRVQKRTNLDGISSKPSPSPDPVGVYRKL